MSLEEHVERLGALLGRVDMVPGEAETAFAAFDDESKDALLAQLSTRLEPAPSGQLLARLPVVVTPTNRDAMVAVFLTNLRSPDARARKACLDGLAFLDYPNTSDFALVSLRDDSDQVVAAAVQVLLAGDQPRGEILRDVYTAHRDDADFHVTTSLLEAHGFGEA